MIRDARYFMLVEKPLTPIVNAISAHRSYNTLKNEVAIFQLYAEPDRLYAIISVSDEIDKIVVDNGGKSNGSDLTIEMLKKDKDAYPIIYGEKDLIDFLKYIIPESPTNCTVSGNSGRKYLFQAFNIDDRFRDDASGVFIFTITVEDKRSGVPINSHVFKSLQSINSTSKEAIKKAKEDGARHFLYYYSLVGYERDEIIADIKEGQDYKYQLATFPELTTSR